MQQDLPENTIPAGLFLLLNINSKSTLKHQTVSFFNVYRLTKSNQIVV